MKRPRNKFIVVSVAVFGIAVLVASGFALKPVILEQWYAWKLESQWKEERWAPAGELQTLRSGAAEDWYLSQLDSEDEEDQERAAENLSELGTLRAIAALIEKLPEDYRSSQSHFTVKALSSIGEPAAPLLLQKLKKEIQESKKGSTAYRVLEEMGSPAVSVLVTALEDDSEDVRFLAVQALGRIGAGSDAAIRALIRNLEDPNIFMRRNTAFALLTLDPQRIEALSVLIKVLREGNVEFKRRAATALGRIGLAARDAIPALQEARRRTVSTSRDKRLQVAAADALKKIRGEISR